VKNSVRILLLGGTLPEVRHMKRRLEAEGLGVQTFRYCARAIERCLDPQFAMVILGTALPGLQGLDLCRQMRIVNQDTPIIMLSAPANRRHCVEAYEAGCDDCIVGPFNIDELVARVKAVLRRYERAHRIATGKIQSGRVKVGDLVIDPGKQLVTLNSKRVDLTAKEYDLLCLLASNPGRAYSRRELLDLLWDYDAEVYECTVNSHINRLRGKIERNARSPRYILTVWGVGYRFTDETSPA